MKNCKVLIGPIAGTDRNYDEGEVIELGDKDADQFASWGFVEVVEIVEPKAKTPAKPTEEVK